MNLDAKQIAYKKQVGTLKGKPVFMLETRGGLSLMVTSDGAGGNAKVLSTGPVRAVARYIAEKREPDMVLNELSKSDYVEPYLYLSVVPEYEALTDKLQKSWGK
jgi:hypothetical protein